MAQQSQTLSTLLLFSTLLFLSLHSSTFTSAQSSSTSASPPALSPAKSPPKPTSPPTPKPTAPPPAQGPAAMVPVQTSKGPLNVLKVLQKAGHFSNFIRLIKTTQEDIQFASQLNASDDGITVFAPTDGAFSAIIKAGVLNSLSDQEKIQLVQFHVIPRQISTPQFQTVSNPLKTLAGSGKRFQLNVTTSDSMVNVTSGLTNATVSGIVYADDKVAIYQVDKVLLPMEIFAPKALAPAPAPPKSLKGEGADGPAVPKDASGAALGCVVGWKNVVMVGAATVAAVALAFL
ncbi:unnamed protein product [Linum tenue]|uniref:FAS1 domain-containing protein n=2 Tax=Linum tenue TaxID=586396 RepID=A0AAV0QBW3_9ROSI|nr:unnamed protein product [Linum tenue]